MTNLQHTHRTVVCLNETQLLQRLGLLDCIGKQGSNCLITQLNSQWWQLICLSGLKKRAHSTSYCTWPGWTLNTPIKWVKSVRGWEYLVVISPPKVWSTDSYYLEMVRSNARIILYYWKPDRPWAKKVLPKSVKWPWGDFAHTISSLPVPWFRLWLFVFEGRARKKPSSL